MNDGGSPRKRRTYILCCLFVLFVLCGWLFVGVLYLQPDYHSPSCGGSNLVIALHGPQGADAHAPGSSQCRPIAIATMSAVLLIFIPFLALFLLGLKERSGRRTAYSTGSAPRVHGIGHDSHPEYVTGLSAAVRWLSGDYTAWPRPARYEGAVEVRLSPGPQDRSERNQSGYRRIHAVSPGTVTACCLGEFLPLMPTLAAWTTAAQPGVHPCEECMSLTPARHSRLPDPRFRRWVLADRTVPQWTYAHSTITLWSLTVFFGGGGLVLALFFAVGGSYAFAGVVFLVSEIVTLCMLWPVCRRRLSVGPSGVTIVRSRGRSDGEPFLWSEISRFEGTRNRDETSLTLVLRDGRVIDLNKVAAPGSTRLRLATALNDTLQLFNENQFGVDSAE